MRELSGYQAGAQLLREILLPLHAEATHGLSDVDFPAPEGYEPVALCALTGERATDACDQVVTEYFAPGSAPVHDCSGHVRLAVDVRTGAPANAATPPAFVETRTYVDLPARYAAWVEETGLGTLPGARTRSLTGSEPVSLDIVSPRDGSHLLPDPEVPAGQGTLRLQVAVAPSVEQVVWYVDGEPFAVVEHPYVARWPLAPGEHVFEARLPFRDASSAPVRVVAQ